MNALSIINRAFELIGYKDPDEALSGNEAQAGLDALNSLVDAWNAQPLFALWQPISSFDDLTTEHNLAPGFRKALEYSLAEDLAPGRRALDPATAKAAFLARRAIRRNNVEVPQLEPVPRVLRSSRFNIDTGNYQ